MCICEDISHSVLYVHNTSKDEVPNGVVSLYIILTKIMKRGIIFSMRSYTTNKYKMVLLIWLQHKLICNSCFHLSVFVEVFCIPCIICVRI